MIKSHDLARLLTNGDEAIRAIAQRFRSGHFRLQIFEEGTEDELLRILRSNRAPTEYEFKQDMIAQLVPVLVAQGEGSGAVGLASNLADRAWIAAQANL